MKLNSSYGRIESSGLIHCPRSFKRKVDCSASMTLGHIDAAFGEIKTRLVDSLERRRAALKAEVISIQKEGLAPLIACREIVCQKLEETEEYILEGKALLGTAVGDLPVVDCSSYCEQASNLGNLPAVPKLEEVPRISFDLRVGEVLPDLLKVVVSAGRVSRMGPVQLTQLEEKPGALLVHWEEVDLERTVDVLSFRLQCAHGDLSESGIATAVEGGGDVEESEGTSKGKGTPTRLPSTSRFLEGNFHDMYRGPETEHLVRDLKPGEQYTFRVCCRVEGDTEWSAWSLPRVAATNQDHFCWEDKNPNYLVTNENKIATKITSDPSILFSRSAQFGSGHSIEFTILEAGVGCSDEGLGLVNTRFDGDSLLQVGALFLNTLGCVFVDGAEKTTRLPPLVKGSKVAFSCERIREDRIRVNIDSNNKTVTYDWRVEGASCESEHFRLFFALCFGETGWKVLVE
ncbi:cytokine receptor-like factor 3 isoform X2 [Ischnura elegans]|uniref:cytokine receptor-like factor 3 isoform X2 n=1 Tax=Ischnura elegans TaxID=197161 RepID=UPI001ED893FC|nr:cytokine receptor-like factor 3 isoform X2 [Ischnura elegans]